MFESNIQCGIDQGLKDLSLHNHKIFVNANVVSNTAKFDLGNVELDFKADAW